MRDLYHLLGGNSGPATSDVELRALVAQRQPDDEVRRSAEAILLNPERRQIYDQTLAVYRTVARLRRRLDLEQTKLWQRETLASLHPWHRPRHPAKGRRRRMALAFIVVVLPITIGLVVLLQSSLPSSLPPSGATDVLPRPSERLGAGNQPPTESVAKSVGRRPNTNGPAVASNVSPAKRQPLPAPGPWRVEDAIAEYRQRRIRPIGPAAIPSWSTPLAVPAASTMTRSLGNMIPRGECELLVTAPPDRHVFVKVIDYYNRELCTPVLIPEGRSMILRVPPGRYDCLFALGDEWYGWVFDFGPSAIYFGTTAGVWFEVGGVAIAFNFTEGVPDGLEKVSRSRFD